MAVEEERELSQEVGSVEDLLKELIANGYLETFDGDELQLPLLLRAILLIRKGALAAGAKLLGSLHTWGKSEIDLLRSTVEPARLLNVVAEDYHGSFGNSMSQGAAGIVCGAILGDLVCRVQRFYDESAEFITRVVGLRYEECLDRVEGLLPGEPVNLLWEPQNPHDPKAIKVLDRNGKDLGYLRRNIAHSLVSRIKRGAALSGRVMVVLGPEFDVNDRLNIEVKVWENSHGFGSCVYDLATRTLSHFVLP